MLLNTCLFDLFLFLCLLVEYWLVVNFYALTVVVTMWGRQLYVYLQALTSITFFYIMPILGGDEILLTCRDE